MLATYGSLLLILAASCLVGQGLFALCGGRRWSWLAPSVGLAIVIGFVFWGSDETIDAPSLSGDQPQQTVPAQPAQGKKVPGE